MSDTEKIFEEFERAADQMQEAAALLKVRLPALKKAMRAADAATAETDALRRSHAEALERIDQFASALSEIEGAIKKSMASAQKALHDHGIPVDERARLLDFARAVFEPLATSGFEVIIPALGEAIDHERHTVKGSVKSELSGSQVADIISWGHHFPSGDQRTAEVLVGDGSLVEREAEEVEPPAAPSAKAGISMVIPDEVQKKTPKTRNAPSGSGGLFERLEEAARKNRGDNA
ncbi:MAG: hypothetical protein C4341_07225 [Armatimonadota bacterium]